MAVKPITNKQVVLKEKINRALQVSQKENPPRSSNREASFTPGLNSVGNFAVTLKDIDTSIMNHIKNVMKLNFEANGISNPVPVMYGNEERWVTARKKSYLRDDEGTIILPLIMFKRTDLEKSTDIQGGFEHDVKRKSVEVVRKSSWSKDNRYDNFAVLTGQKPVREAIVTGFPDFVNITYEFILWSNFIEQMNVILEAFVEQTNQYWGDSEDHKFLCNMDPISDASEMDVSGERFIKSTFSLTAKGYLLPEYYNNIIVGTVAQTKRKLSPSKVVFGFDGDATDKQVKK